MTYINRISAARGMMKDKGLEALYVTSAENVFYLSGFTGFGDARLYITPNEAYIITDSRYTVQSAHECPDYVLISGNAESPDTLDGVLPRDRNIRVGFEDEKISYKDHNALKERFGLIEEGDMIAIDIPNARIDVLVDEETLAARKAAYIQPEPNIKTGWLARYARQVSGANQGAVMK